MFKKTISALLLLATLAPAWAAGWMTDLEAAKAKAAAENKAVLIDFTGSDWCGWCIRLRKDVFDTPAFETYARDKFVLMEVDLPNNPKFDKELRARNEALCAQYGVDGFPTILVITPQGEVAGGFSGYLPTVDAVSRTLDAGLSTAALLQKARNQQGEEQLATLAQAYRSIPDQLKQSSASLRRRIVELDPRDTTGLGRLQRIEDQQNALQQALSKADTQAEALLAVDTALASAEPENKLGMLQLKFQIMLTGARTVDEVKAAAAVGRQAIEADPQASAAILKQFDAQFASPEKVLDRLNTLRSRRPATPENK